MGVNKGSPRQQRVTMKSFQICLVILCVAVLASSMEIGDRKKGKPKPGKGKPKPAPPAGGNGGGGKGKEGGNGGVGGKGGEGGKGGNAGEGSADWPKVWEMIGELEEMLKNIESYGGEGMGGKGGEEE